MASTMLGWSSPPKGTSERGSGDRAARHASGTRPLSLTNCDNKLIASLVAKYLDAIASGMVSPIQAGGIAGRSTRDKMFEVEAKAI
eukprot:4196788-Alexandrium_andersonii.AAC.1